MQENDLLRMTFYCWVSDQYNVLRELNGLRQTVSDIVVPKKGQAHFGAKPFSEQQSKVCIVSGFLHCISPHHQLWTQFLPRMFEPNVARCGP